MLEIEIIAEVPERQLLSEIIGRAMRDVLNKEHDTTHWKRDAEAWFYSGDQKPWSFLWLCWQLDLEPTVIFARLKTKEKLYVR